MATTKKSTAEKKTVETKSDVSTALTTTAAPLTSAAMAQFAKFDLTQFADVGLDVAENKELFSNDLLIPKVWLIQSMSELRKQEKAKEGQFVDSQNNEILVDRGGTLRFVVLKTFKRWHTFKLVKTKGDVKKEFLSSEIMVLGKNHDLKYEDTLDGQEIVRRQVISAYVLLEKDAINGVNKPYIIDFASTSKHAGRVMVSDISTLNNNKLPSFAGFFEMTAEEESFTGGDAYVKKIKFGGYLPEKAMPFLISCYKGLITIQDQIEIDDRDVMRGQDDSAQVEKDVSKKADVANSKI
jgi:hypothetical protein